MNLTLISFVVLIVCAPLAIGSVYIFTYSAIEVVIFSLLAMRAFQMFRGTVPVDRGHQGRVLLYMVPIILFLLVVLFQMVPLPQPLLRFLSPSTGELYDKLGLTEPGRLFPLSMSIYHTSAAFLKWAAYAGIFYLVATFEPVESSLAYPKWLNILMIAFITIGVLEAVYGLFTSINQPDSLLWFKRKQDVDSVAGTYINRNHFAGLMEMTIPIGIAFLIQAVRSRAGGREPLTAIIGRAVHSKGSIFLWVAVFSVLIMMVALIFSLSRMGQFSFIISLACVLALLAKKRMKGAFLVVLILISLGVLWGAWKGLEPVMERWGQAEKALSEGRGVIWMATFSLIGAFLPFGTGLGTFEFVYKPYQPEKFGTTVYDHAHNDYLELFSEVGFAGFIPLLLFFAVFLSVSVRAWLNSNDARARTVGAAGIMATIAILVHSLADFNLQIPANTMLLFIVMGMTCRVLNAPVGQKKNRLPEARS